MNYSILALLLLVCLSIKHTMAQDYEPVCPMDSILVIAADTSALSEGGQQFPSQRQRKAQEATSPPIVQVVRQGGDWVEFVVHNTTTFAEVPDHIFVSSDTNLYHSLQCLMDTDLGPADLPTSVTEAQKATCFDTPHGGMMALVRVYARTMIINGPRIHTRNIPKCCQDPYASTAIMYNTVEYIYEVPCAATCDEPENYFENGDDNDDNDNDTTSPTAAPDPVTDAPTMFTGSPTSTAPPTGNTGNTGLPTFLNSPGMTGEISEDPTAMDVDADPTEAPTETDSEPPTPGPTAAPTTKSPTSSPTAIATASPTLGLVAPPPMCSSESTVAPQSRDLVMGSQLNGPHMGSRHGWAWPQIRDKSCSRFSNVDSEGAGAYAWPCYTATQALNRVLNFDSSYMNFQFEFDRGMKATISLADTASGDVTAQEESVSFYPSGASASNACSAPPDASWDYYPLRLVKSGRYHHHWYAEKVNCNGGADDTRLEIKVTPDCVEVHMVSNEGAQTMNWLDGDSQIPLVSSSNGYSGISYCVQCDSEVNGSIVNANDALSGCSIVETPIPTDCCPLNPASVYDGTVRAGTSYKDPMCGSGWDYDTCTASSLVTTAMTEDVTLSTVPNYPIKADGHSFQVEVPRGSGNQMTNDDLVAVVQNNSNSWKKVKVNFHIKKPRRMTGISGVLLDPETNKPTGIHVQMSKNWHINRPMMYDGYWWTGIAHFRVPPGETKLKLVVAYQYYEGLHGVSHSQLSLMGWATNGLWEEVGLGSNGESITYEPHGHHRRQMILDTRPWLVCQMNKDGCGGTPDSTQWTENVGGGDFLNAVDKNGKYQYLVGDTVYHTMNGPRLTNATYAGTTVDQKIAVSRTVSTWTADDFVRHLHSFEYNFLEDTPGDHYQRFAMYTLGGDNYNYVRFPLFAYGSGETNGLMETFCDETIPVSDIIDGVADFKYTNYYSVDAPVGCSNHDDSSSCWFSMLTDPSVNIHQRGNRGIIVRNFRGQLNGEAWPPANQEVSPFTFNLIKSRQNGSAKDTLSIELGLPSEFKAAVDAGLAEFKEGDFLKADIELLVPPRQNADYFGKSNRLKAWMTDVGVDANFGEGWKLIAKEATEGDKIATTVFQGDLERIYHPRVKVDCGSNEARFNIDIPGGLPGILPITIAGVSENMAPLDAPLQQLWRYDASAGGWKPFANGAAYQLEKDVLDNSYTFVYSLSLEFANQSSGTAVAGNGACEQFFFGENPPSDTNPSCVGN